MDGINMKKHEMGNEKNEHKKAPNKETLDAQNTNPTFSFSDNRLVIQSDECLIKLIQQRWD
jgi:hypothetical protein